MSLMLLFCLDAAWQDRLPNTERVDSSVMAGRELVWNRCPVRCVEPPLNQLGDVMA
jgi:hypothetical protein